MPSVSTAIADADIQFTFTTLGNARPGLIIFTFPIFEIGASGDGSSVVESLSIGNIKQNCYAAPIPSCNVSPGATLELPFELGVPYTFDYNVSLTAADGDWDFPEGNFNGTINYQLIDPNAPEPTSLGLAGCGLLLLHFLRRNLPRIRSELILSAVPAAQL